MVRTRSVGWVVALGFLAACASPPAARVPPLGLVLPDGAVYHGGLRDGLLHGRGRLAYPSGAVYEGEFEAGSRHGRGRVTEPSGTVYEGEFFRGSRHGRGRIDYASGARYEGELRAGVAHGRGVYAASNGMVYDGEFRHDEFHGRGRLSFRGGAVYEGDFVHGDFRGSGELREADGAVYRGEFRDDEFHGQGRLTGSDGSTYTGGFAKGLFHGAGRFESAGGGVFEGEFREGAFTGYGTHRWPDGTLYAGWFADWDFHGEGVLVRADGARYAGGFEDDRYHGQGRFEAPDGKVYVGGFAEGRYHGEGTLTWSDEAGARRVATGVWEKGRYVRGDADELLARPSLDAEALLYRQPERVRRALEGVQASRPGVPDLYFLGFAGWGAQRVFAREVRFTRRTFEDALGARGRTLALLNDREDPDAEPLATVSNLELALRGLAERMDPEEDILFLLITSHGSKESGVGVDLERLPLNDLPPQRLDALLDAAGIRWRVVVVSACYSGLFVEPLRDDATMVITASAPDRTSFGCSDEAEFTTFGGAFLRDALPGAASFADAFELARRRVRQLEDAEDREPSKPELVAGRAITRRLAAWRATLTPRAAVVPEATPPAAPE